MVYLATVYCLLSALSAMSSNKQLSFFTQGAARWASMCMLGSPWLFTLPDVKKHTIADHVQVRFTGFSAEEVDAFVDEAAKSLVTDHKTHSFVELRIRDPVGAYDPWTELFEFKWASLELHVDRTSPHDACAVFVDYTGAVSRRMYVEEGDSCGVDMTDPNNEVIPWLYCE